MRFVRLLFEVLPPSVRRLRKMCVFCAKLKCRLFTIEMAARGSTGASNRQRNACFTQEELGNVIEDLSDISSGSEGSDFEVEENVESDSDDETSDAEPNTEPTATGDTWRRVGSAMGNPLRYVFSKNAGSKTNFPGPVEPLDYFLLLFDEELFEKIANETNRYAANKISKLQLSPRSTWKSWRDVSDEEMKAFIGIIVNMGMVTMPDIKDYWSSEWVCQMNFFRDVMSRDRFLQIFRMLHVGNDTVTTNSLAMKRTQKIQGVVEYIENKFQKYFVPGEKIAIDESTVGFKGRISYKTYNPKKPTKWGLRLFVLADSNTGYVHSIIPYYGKETGDICKLPHEDKPFTTRIVLSLMDRLGLCVNDVEGYHLYTDRYYSSVTLANELYNRKCHTTGTIIGGRSGNPKQLKTNEIKKMKSGNVCGFRSGNVLVLAWKDKRLVIMISTYHNQSVENITSILKGGQIKEVSKPTCVLDYTKHMGGVDRSDHYCATYCFIRKTLKWWRKLFFWCLEVCIVNSYILYQCEMSKIGSTPITHVKYRRCLVEGLVGNVRNSRKRKNTERVDLGERLNDRKHFIYPMEKKKHKDCCVCSNRKIKGCRKETSYYCKTCSSNPALCPGTCFERYHSLEKYKLY